MATEDARWMSGPIHPIAARARRTRRDATHPRAEDLAVRREVLPERVRVRGALQTADVDDVALLASSHRARSRSEDRGREARRDREVFLEDVGSPGSQGCCDACVVSTLS